MKTQFIDNKTIQLMEDGQIYGQIIYKYENYISPKAQIKIPNSQILEINSLGVFGTSLSITHNEVELAKLKMSWSGQMVLTYVGGKEYIIRGKDLFLKCFLAEDINGELLIQFELSNEWKNFSYNYDILVAKKPVDILFVLIGIYACNYLTSLASGASSGLG